MLEAARTEAAEEDASESESDSESESESESEEDDDLWRMPIDDAPSEGPADALVTIVEMTDFQCPYCARGAATMTALRQRFPDDVRIVVRQRPLPFHENARPAATAALEARAQHGDAGFFRMAALLFANQRGLGRATLERLAVLEGLDLPRFRHALDTNAYDAVLARDMALGDRMGAEGTPTFYVNGELMVGAQPLASFVHAVDRARTRAQAALDAGASREHLYEAMLAHAQDPGPIPVEPTRPPPPAPSDVAHPPAGAHATEGGASYIVEHAGDPDDDGATRVIRARLASWNASGAVLEGSSPTPINVLLDGLDPVLAAALRGMRAGEIRRVWLPGPRVIWVEAVDVQ
jgi:predicted DsbA family dithiol-disulfide isomerase